ncbi:hypothetical protein [Streptomyces scabiei]|uniref:hypothetical protein n=1 Tax=Streptomyces scabiei TaxID=1930 RepID=UPI001B338626|nr:MULTISPECIES: hypothetical protein [Streptomyces]MBP5896422.1 hypothetical protein [Streptomyces sp. LBUM 1481]MDX3122743.1 hypothetical protein [Streptomyces scabiei]MDX3199342.1 hypothetical protein [Streptomyces scabiei]MDX3223218.1 hypothetical protein [Streptomyces scabiei]
MHEPPEYLPRPDGYEERVAALVAGGTSTTDAHWMAACEAIGAVGRRETNHRDLFWFGDMPDEQREVWDRIADREGKRFYFHQKRDTLVGYLAHGRHSARLNDQLGNERQESLTKFIKEHGLWDAWVTHNLSRQASEDTTT